MPGGGRPVCAFIARLLCDHAGGVPFGGQHLAGEIERAGDEDARRRIEIEPRDRGERRLDVVAALRRDADGARGIRDRVRRRGSSPGAGSAPRRRGGRARQNSAGNPRKSLVASMPTTSTSGRDTRSSRSASALAMARPPSALWPPSSHSSLPGGSQRRQRPCDSRCMRAGQSALAMPASNAARRQLQGRGRAQRRDGDAGILELMAAVEFRRRQIEQARRRPDRPAGRAPRSRSSPRRRS